LNVGELSDLINADNTCFIIKLEEKKPAHQMTFEEAKDKLKKELEKKRSNELREKWMADLRAKAKIEIVYSRGALSAPTVDGRQETGRRRLGVKRE